MGGVGYHINLKDGLHCQTCGRKKPSPITLAKFFYLNDLPICEFCVVAIELGAMIDKNIK